jgi:hypothetical protein
MLPPARPDYENLHRPVIESGNQGGRKTNFNRAIPGWQRVGTAFFELSNKPFVHPNCAVRSGTLKMSYIPGAGIRLFVLDFGAGSGREKTLIDKPIILNYETPTSTCFGNMCGLVADPTPGAG